MANTFKDLTPEQRTANGIKGGKASGEAKRKNRRLRDIAKIMLGAMVDDPELANRLTNVGLNQTYADAMVLAQVAKAVNGDNDSFRTIRDTIGEKPTDAYNLSIIDKPVASMDLRNLSDEELNAMLAASEDN